MKLYPEQMTIEPGPPLQKSLFRVDEAARLLRCSPRSVRRYIREGKLVRQRRGLVTRGSLMKCLGMGEWEVESGKWRVGSGKFKPKLN